MPNETGCGASSTLHCCETLESGEQKTSKKEKPPADKTYNLCFTSRFWRKNIAISKEAMHTNFVLLGPLICAVPLLAGTDMYFSRSVFVVFVLYVTTGIMFLKNMINLWVCSNASKTAITLKTAALHVLLVGTFLVGVTAVAYYIAAGDNMVKNWENTHPENDKAFIENQECSLVWGVTAPVHSYVGVVCIYAVVAPLALLVVLSESVQNRDKDQFCLNNYRVKTLVSLLGMCLALGEIKLREYFLERNSPSTSMAQPAKVFLLICCFYLPLILIKEIEFYSLRFPKKLDFPRSKKVLWLAINHGLAAVTCGGIVAVAVTASSKL